MGCLAELWSSMGFYQTNAPIPVAAAVRMLRCAAQEAADIDLRRRRHA